MKLKAQLVGYEGETSLVALEITAAEAEKLSHLSLMFGLSLQLRRTPQGPIMVALLEGSEVITYKRTCLSRASEKASELINTTHERRMR